LNEHLFDEKSDFSKKSDFLDNILNVGITWISWGATPGYINIAPLGLEKISWGATPGYINIAPLGLESNYLSYFGFSKSPICPLLE
jgi:hypothetical protein